MNPKLIRLSAALALAAGASATNLDVPTAAQEGPPPGVRPTPAVKSTDLATAVDEVSAKLRQGKLSPQDFETLKTAVQQRPEAGRPDPHARIVTARMQSMIDAMRMRSETAKLSAQHVDALREQIVDEQLDLQVDALASAAQAGDASGIDFNVLSSLIDRRADVSRSYDRKAEELRSAMNREVQELRKLAEERKLDAARVDQFRRELAELRLSHAIDVLETTATTGDTTRLEFLRVRGLLEDFAARVPNDAEFARVRQSLEMQLNELEPQLESGGLDPTQIAKLREPLRQAREASSRKEKPKEPDKPQDGGH